MVRFNEKNLIIHRSSASKEKVSGLNRHTETSFKHSEDDENCNRRHETSLGKNSINTPKNMRRFTFSKGNNSTSNALLGSENINQEDKHISLPKTASTINNNRIYTPQIETEIDRKQISKELLSQVHFCRFVFKLLQRINHKIDGKISESVRDKMHGIIFKKLKEVEELTTVEKNKASEYKKTADFQKICQIVDQYQKKYEKEISFSGKWGGYEGFQN